MDALSFEFSTKTPSKDLSNAFTRFQELFFPHRPSKSGQSAITGIIVRLIQLKAVDVYLGASVVTLFFPPLLDLCDVLTEVFIMKTDTYNTLLESLG